MKEEEKKSGGARDKLNDEKNIKDKSKAEHVSERVSRVPFHKKKWKPHVTGPLDIHKRDENE